MRYYLRKYDSDTREKYKKNYGLDIPDNNKLYKFANNENLFFEYTLPEPLPPIIGIDKNGGAKQRFGMFIKKLPNTPPQLEFIDVIVTVHDPMSGSVLTDYKAPGEYEKDKQFGRYPREVTIQTKSDKADLYSALFVPAENEQKDKYYQNGVKYKLRSGTIYETAAAEFDLEKDFVNILDKFVILSMRKKDKSGYDIKKFSPVVTETKENSKSTTTIEGPKGQPLLLKTFEELNKKEHMPHCIARALQLLDAASINNALPKNPGVTRICSSDINGTGKSYQPIRAIGQLYGKLNVTKLISVNPEEFRQAEIILKAFVGKESIGDPLTVDALKTDLKQESESNDMSAAIEKLSKAFQANQKASEQYKSFDDIKVGKPTACTSDKHIEIQKGGPLFLDMQRHSQQLLAHHLNSVIDISKFLQTVFTMSQRADGSWKVEGPKTELLFAGFQVLDTLTEQARKLLINYYSGCEDIYQKGVKVWVDSAPTAANKTNSKPIEGQILPSAPKVNVVPSAPKVNVVPSK
jgi:hypothetical protein